MKLPISKAANTYLFVILGDWNAKACVDAYLTWTYIIGRLVTVKQIFSNFFKDFSNSSTNSNSSFPTHFITINKQEEIPGMTQME